MKSAILLIGNFLSATRGVSGVSEGLAQQLKAAGWTVHTASDKPGRMARMADMLATTWRMRAHFQIAHVEVYSGHAFIWAELVCGLLARLGKPYVLTLHGGNLPNFARRWPQRVRRLLSGAAAVTAPSPYLCERMKPYRDDLQLLPNPLDFTAYPCAVRNVLRPRLIWLRAFHAIYNPVLAVRVLAALAPEFPDVQLTMIGPDKGDGSRADTQRAAAALGVAERLTLTGAIAKADVPAALAAHDIFLNTTNVDNTPVSVLEALACGLCVVSTAVDGIPYLLEHASDALLVPPADAAAMTAAVRRLLTQPELAETLARQGRRKAAQFDWPLILPQWEALLAAAQAK